MGIVHKPEDILKGRKGRINRSLRDLNPSLKDSVIRILESWEDGVSEEKLVELLGKNRVKLILESLR